MERVSLISGKLPMILIAPHGYDEDDKNTGFIAETVARNIECYAVINNGWERADTVDYLNDKADCNNVHHCREDVVREEFLEPILRFKNIIQKYNGAVYIMYIHGMGNKHRSVAKNPDLDLVLGFGAGNPASLTCEMWQKNFMLYNLNKVGIVSYEGRAGGQMSGWSRNNMNQYFRKWEYDRYVYSMQLEIIYELREEKDLALITSEYLSSVLQDLCVAQGYNGPASFSCY